MISLRHAMICLCLCFSPQDKNHIRPAAASVAWAVPGRKEWITFPEAGQNPESGKTGRDKSNLAVKGVAVTDEATSAM